jgi:hypothetical protein
MGETLSGFERSPLEDLAALGDAALPEALRERLLTQYLLDQAELQKVNATLVLAKAQLAEVEKAAKPQQVMVLAQREKPRPTHVLQRGVWDAPGEAVKSGVIAAVLDWPAERTQTRAELARWLVSAENPLTARVLVNHLWQLVFGEGLVRTPEDFGLQGELPTHPELLDGLALELI